MTKIDHKLCKKIVTHIEGWRSYEHQCTRKAKADGFCFQHNPEETKARYKRAVDRWEKKTHNTAESKLCRAKAVLRKILKLSLNDGIGPQEKSAIGEINKLAKGFFAAETRN